MKKHIFGILAVCILALFPFHSAYAAPANNSIAPAFVYTYEETITKEYNTIDISQVPTTFYYEYYSEGWQSWMRGTLSRTSYEINVKKGTITATFKGTMRSSPT